MNNQNQTNDIAKISEYKCVLTEIEAAKYIGMSRSFLSQDRMNGYREGRTQGPDYMKLGRAIRYHKDDLDKWLLKNRIRRSA